MTCRYGLAAMLWAATGLAAQSPLESNGLVTVLDSTHIGVILVGSGVYRMPWEVFVRGSAPPIRLVELYACYPVPNPQSEMLLAEKGTRSVVTWSRVVSGSCPRWAPMVSLSSSTGAGTVYELVALGEQPEIVFAILEFG